MNFRFEPFNKAVLRLLVRQMLIISHERTSCYEENCNAYHAPIIGMGYQLSATLLP